MEVDSARCYATAGDFALTRQRARGADRRAPRRPVVARVALGATPSDRQRGRHGRRVAAAGSLVIFGGQQKRHGDALKVERDDLRSIATSSSSTTRSLDLPGATAARAMVVARGKLLGGWRARRATTRRCNRLMSAHARLAVVLAERARPTGEASARMHYDALASPTRRGASPSDLDSRAMVDRHKLGLLLAFDLGLPRQRWLRAALPAPSAIELAPHVEGVAYAAIEICTSWRRERGAAEEAPIWRGGGGV